MCRVQIVIQVELERLIDGDVPPVHAPRFPGTKAEFWWLVCGDHDDNVLAIKRVSFDQKHKATLKLDSFTRGQRNDFKLYFMCDSYLGCDQEYGFTVDVSEDAPMEQD